MKLAPVDIVDYSKIKSKDPRAINELLKACQSSGLFFLDLRNDSAGREILSYVPDAYRASDEYFHGATEKKMKDYRADQPSSQDRGLVYLSPAKKACLVFAGIKEVTVMKHSR